MTDSTPATSRFLTVTRVVLAVIVALWLIEIIDVLLFDHALERQGIQPRSWSGLDGVLMAPFLHDDYAHLISNTIPLAVLGTLVLLRGIPRWFQVTAVVVVAGGLATWLLARNANHIGASGVVFGYLGFLLAAGFFERSLRAVALGIATGLAYGGLLLGVLPTRPGVSWESHLFGLLAGGAAAWWLLPPRN
ncbi:rhomboid family intramembrane serine protease [Actinomycetota bacterium]